MGLVSCWLLSVAIPTGCFGDDGSGRKALAQIGADRSGGSGRVEWQRNGDIVRHIVEMAEDGLPTLRGDLDDDGGHVGCSNKGGMPLRP